MLSGAGWLHPGAMPLSRAIAIFTIVVYNLIGIAAFLHPETRGRELAS